MNDEHTCIHEADLATVKQDVVNTKNIVALFREDVNKNTDELKANITKLFARYEELYKTLIVNTPNWKTVTFLISTMTGIIGMLIGLIIKFHAN